MNDEKKYWLLQVNPRLWVPISIEGWLMLCATILGIYLVGELNGRPEMSETFTWEKHGLVLCEMCGVGLISYFVSRPHVKRLRK